MNKKLYWISAGFSLIYIINPTLGVFEFIPDNLPIVGNLDEATATGVLLYSLRELGILKRKGKKEEVLNEDVK